MGPRPCAVFLVAPRGVLSGRALCAPCWAGLLVVPVGGGLPACVACGPTGVPGAVGPGRPRDRHTRACGSEWSISKPARALRTLRRPPRRWRLRCCVVPSRPRHRPRAPQPGPRVPPAPSTPVAPSVLCGAVQAPPPPTGTAARPSGPSDAPPHRRRLACWCVSRCVVSKPARALRSLRRPPHLWCLVAVCAGGWRPAREPSAPRASLGASTRCPARPCRPPAPRRDPLPTGVVSSPRLPHC